MFTIPQPRGGHEYLPGKSIDELAAELHALLGVARATERLICRYLADWHDCFVEAPWPGYADVFHAAKVVFAMSARRARERIRIGKALRELRRIETAFISGEVAYSRVREITRVATPADEERWLALARHLPIRTLERRVAEAGGRAVEEVAEHEKPPAVTWASADRLDVTLQLPAATWALLERAMEGARRAAEGTTLLSDAEALEAVARDALALQAAVHSSDASCLQRTVVLYECQSCGRAELETGKGAVELGDGAAAAVGCGAVVRDLRSEGRVVRRGGPIPKAVRRAVLLRDRGRCRVPGCERRRYVDVHHREARAEGGEHSRLPGAVHQPPPTAPRGAAAHRRRRRRRSPLLRRPRRAHRRRLR
jgi:hypothetical protein